MISSSLRFSSLLFTFPNATSKSSCSPKPIVFGLVRSSMVYGYPTGFFCSSKFLVASLIYAACMIFAEPASRFGTTGQADGNGEWSCFQCQTGGLVCLCPWPALDYQLAQSSCPAPSSGSHMKSSPRVGRMAQF